MNQAPIPAKSFPLRLPRTASVLLLASFCGIFAVSLNKKIWTDELLEFYTDHQSCTGMMQALLRHTFSLEPPAFHLIGHLFLLLFGANAQALRLPSMLCFVLAQYCIFCVVRGLGNERAALVALVLPTLTYARHYSDEGRSYALLLAMGTLALLCWYRAVMSPVGKSRWPELFGLAAALGLAITSHYYGLLLLAPFYLAEAARSIERKRIDVPVLASLLAGTAALLIDLPFSKEALEFKAHYYAQTPGHQTIGNSYLWLLAIYPHNRALALCVLAGLGALVLVAAWIVLRRRVEAIAISVWLAPAGLFFLPVFAYLLGRFVTHAFEPRYTLPAIGGIAVMVGFALTRLMESKPMFYVVAGIFIAISIMLTCFEVQYRRGEMKDFRAEMQLPAELLDSNGAPASTIYVCSVEEFLLAHFYLRPDVADHYTLVESMSLEYGWLHHDAGSHFAINIGKTYPGFHVISYKEFRALPGNKLVLVNDHDGIDEWFDRQLQQDGYQLQPEAHHLLGTLSLATPRRKN